MITKDTFMKYILPPFLVFIIVILCIRLNIIMNENEQLKQQIQELQQKEEIINSDEKILEFNDVQYKLYKCDGEAI